MIHCKRSLLETVSYDSLGSQALFQRVFGGIKCFIRIDKHPHSTGGFRLVFTEMYLILQIPSYTELIIGQKEMDWSWWISDFSVSCQKTLYCSPCFHNGNCHQSISQQYAPILPLRLGFDIPNSKNGIPNLTHQTVYF